MMTTTMTTVMIAATIVARAVAVMLGVLGKLLVLVEQLRGIAASAAVDPVARIGAALIAITPASATAVIIAIVVQG